jgi:hypothetical protein
MKDVAKKESTELSMENDIGFWGQNESSSNDIVIPKIQLMQGLSQLVSEGKAKLGDYVDSVSKEVIGGVDKPIEAVPFHMEKFYVIQKFTGRRYEYQGYEKITPANENLPYEYEDKGQKMKRVYTRRFYVLIDGNVLPYTIDFSSTSSKSGKELATEMFVKNAMMKLPPAASKIAIGSQVVKGEDTYAVKTIKIIGKTSSEDIKKAFDWYKTVSKSAVIDGPGEF